MPTYEIANQNTRFLSQFVGSAMGSGILPSLDEVVLQDVQTAHHLGKDEHTVTPSLQFGEQLVYKHQFSCSLYHGLEVELWVV